MVQESFGKVLMILLTKRSRIFSFVFGERVHVVDVCLVKAALNKKTEHESEADHDQ